MMSRKRPVRWAFVIVTAGMLASAGAQPARKPKPVTSKRSAVSQIPRLEPKALDLLKAASNRLSAARSMTFTAEVTYESPSRSGQPLTHSTRSEVMLQRPDKLRVSTCCDGPGSNFYYDGKSMWAFAPAEN